jgi:hypothetical protein
VQAIIQTYFPGKAGLVSDVKWIEGINGLKTTPQHGTHDRGSIEVGRDFLNQTPTGFARRVLQVGHELEHIEQYRAGLGAPQYKDMREFLAFYHEALAPEHPGTGRVDHGTRMNLIDAGLGYYNCLGGVEQHTHADQQRELLTARETHNGRGGHAPTAPPAGCHRQP